MNPTGHTKTTLVILRRLHYDTLKGPIQSSSERRRGTRGPCEPELYERGPHDGESSVDGVTLFDSTYPSGVASRDEVSG